MPDDEEKAARLRIEELEGVVESYVERSRAAEEREAKLQQEVEALRGRAAQDKAETLEITDNFFRQLKGWTGPATCVASWQVSALPTGFQRKSRPAWHGSGPCHSTGAPGCEDSSDEGHPRIESCGFGFHSHLCRLRHRVPDPMALSPGGCP
jgi:hypothetical protein